MTDYEAGFIAKCAERGVDVRTAMLMKRADSRLGHEIAGGAITSALPYVNLAGGVGSMLGSLNGRDLSDEELEELTESRENGMNYVPGVAHYRLAQRNNALARKIVERAKELKVKKVRPTRHAITESLGNVINPINWVAGPIGALVAAGKKHRTLDEQVEHDSKAVSLANLLVPGYAGYHGALRAGASRDVVEKKKKKKDDRGKKNENGKDGSSDKKAEALPLSSLLKAAKSSKKKDISAKKMIGSGALGGAALTLPLYAFLALKGRKAEAMKWFRDAMNSEKARLSKLMEAAGVGAPKSIHDIPLSRIGRSTIDANKEAIRKRFADEAKHLPKDLALASGVGAAGGAGGGGLAYLHEKDSEDRSVLRDVVNTGTVGALLGGGAHAAIEAPRLISALKELDGGPRAIVEPIANRLQKTYAKRVGKTGLIAGGALAALQLLLSVNRGNGNSNNNQA